MGKSDPWALVYTGKGNGERSGRGGSQLERGWWVILQKGDEDVCFVYGIYRKLYTWKVVRSCFRLHLTSLTTFSTIYSVHQVSITFWCVHVSDSFFFSLSHHSFFDIYRCQHIIRTYIFQGITFEVPRSSIWSTLPGPSLASFITAESLQMPAPAVWTSDASRSGESSYI